MVQDKTSIKKIYTIEGEEGGWLLRFDKKGESKKKKGYAWE